MSGKKFLNSDKGSMYVKNLREANPEGYVKTERITY